MTVLAPAQPGMPVDEVDTPALLLDLDAFEANLHALHDAVRGLGARVRPHAKSHKCAEIARRQIAAGAIGICCQKVSEAEAFVDAGIRDVAVTNEIVGAAKLRRLAQLARRARISVCVDDPVNVVDLSHAADAAGVVIDVLVEIDVGSRRCGVLPGAAAAQLVRAVKNAPYLRFAGIHAYHGSAQHVRDAAERAAQAATAASYAAATRDAIAQYSIACETITGGGTGTCLSDARSGVYNELQPGSYIFMDADYARNDWSGMPHFRQSLFVLAGVMSATAADRVVVDAGLKALAFDSGLPLVADRPGLEYVKASDEHGVIAVSAGAMRPVPGDRLRLVPGHCDPTVNLHDHIVAFRGNVVEAVWPVVARGAHW